jgi:hypothetical protein
MPSPLDTLTRIFQHNTQAYENYVRDGPPARKPGHNEANAQAFAPPLDHEADGSEEFNILPRGRPLAQAHRELLDSSIEQTGTYGLEHSSDAIDASMSETDEPVERA